MDFPIIKDTESCTHGGQKYLETLLLPLRESGSASAPDESPCLPFLGRNDLRPNNAAASHSHYGTTAISIRTRTVSHNGTDEKDRILARRSCEPHKQKQLTEYNCV